MHVPAEDDVDLAPVAQLAAGAGHGEAAERGAAEVEVRAAAGADPAGALVGDDDRDGAARADAVVQAPDLVAGAAALAGLEQHGAHGAHARHHRHHVHQRPVPARAACRWLIIVIEHGDIGIRETNTESDTVITIDSSSYIISYKKVKPARHARGQKVLVTEWPDLAKRATEYL